MSPPETVEQTSPILPPSDSTLPATVTSVRRSWPVQLLMGLVALVALGGAGYVIRDQLRNWDGLGNLARAEPTPTAPGFPPGSALPGVNGDTSPGHISRLDIGRAGDRPLVVLGPNRFQSGLGQHHLLEAELHRQAVLIAARDGAGARVADERIGEGPAPGARPDRPGLEVHYRMGVDRLAHLSIRDGAQYKILWSRDYRASDAIPPRVAPLVAALESMTREGLPEALAKAGLPATPAAKTPPADAPLPAAIEADLARPSFVAQFAAIRALHAAIRAEGETPTRLSALARAYALLGVLTEYHWSAAHRAYEARALLYAERLAVSRPEDPRSFWTRAYARGLVGLHREALFDLNAARAKIEAMPAARRPTPPAWVELVDRRIRFDLPGLLAATRQPDQAPLAAALAVMTVDHSPARAQAIATIDQVREVDPTNLWMIDVGSWFQGISHLHAYTEFGLTAYGAVVPREIRALPGLPAELSAAIDAWTGSDGEVAAIQALVEAGEVARDPGEPSYAALAAMAREARFAPIARRVQFMATMWGVPVDEFLDQARPLVGRHPYWPLLALHGSGLAPREQADMVAALRAVPRDGLDDAEMFLYQSLGRYDVAVAKEIWAEARLHNDLTERDQQILIRPGGNDPANAARALNDISPYSPTGAAGLVNAGVPSLEADWNRDQMTRHAEHPEYLVALGRRKVQDGKPDEAIPLLQKAIGLSPDLNTYRVLADVQKKAGRIDDWKATLEKFLSESDPGLDHAQVQVELAKYHMDRKEWDQAIPYADAAAETWAGWAMITASKCHEGKEDWENAELWARRVSERYENSSAYWFLFCQRTGQGDILAAGEMLSATALANWEDASPSLLDQLGLYFILAGEPKRARDTYETMIQRLAPNAPERPTAWLKVALLADATGDAPGRDKALDESLALLEPTAPRFTQIVRAIRDGVRAPGGTPLDLGPIDEAIGQIPDDQSGREAKSNIGYVIGQFAARHGRPAEAARYYELVMEPRLPGAHDRPLARAALRESAAKP